ncbi:cytochrome b [Acidisoma cladoniae]|jgi:cytochrome b561|uniref:cytochrome b n=1 Tax=Acidisoma cladoniae TaxID=3040935 RepID=UPI00254A9342|nr:cytochrome b [Acidisoma sp. PAMC 29798]
MTNKPLIPGARYDGLAMALHWVTALLVVTLFTLAHVWVFLHRGGAARHSLQWIHISLGISLAAIVILRLVWRGGFSRKLPPATTGIAEWAARGMHLGLYALLITMVVAGLTKIWSQGHAASFFGLFSVSAPFQIDRSWKPLADTVHDWGAWTIIALAGLHATAALFHHYVVRDGVLRRMMPGQR